MGTTMNSEAYRRLVSEDLEWLLKNTPHSSERMHIESILKDQLRDGAKRDKKLESVVEKVIDAINLEYDDSELCTDYAFVGWILQTLSNATNADTAGEANDSIS